MIATRVVSGSSSTVGVLARTTDSHGSSGGLHIDTSFCRGDRRFNDKSPLDAKGRRDFGQLDIEMTFSDFHQFLQGGAVGTLQQVQHPGSLAAFARVRSELRQSGLLRSAAIGMERSTRASSVF